MERIAEETAIALMFVNGAPVCRMAPWGGREARHGTNPIAMGFPSRSGPPVVLDMTTSAVAEGKVRVQRNRGAEVPDGWLLDAEGQPTNDPHTLYADPPGTILPLGGSLGHKGYGLNVGVELLAGALAGAGCIGQDPALPQRGTAIGARRGKAGGVGRLFRRGRHVHRVC